ncbi:amidase signature domain-containing protein [Aspergillus sergii]|uniref:Amidase signature domain-containing protein n=1 Tax=Aspergillus sergii TaxID=1034303 RepID=A0A5N6WND5_9EURO|nr:amidase signature domain-containing protein [Aspergillus sergii]
MLASGQVSAEDMIRGYIGRACEAQRKTNCLTDLCFDDAIDQARHLDNFQRTHGQLIGPLHGVPMSVKDQFNIKGLDSTLGYVCNAFTPAKSDAPLVHTLKQLGAIIIAKTNQPQSIMWCETDKPALGFDHTSNQFEAHSWGLLRWRGRSAGSRWLIDRLGD